MQSDEGSNPAVTAGHFIAAMLVCIAGIGAVFLSFGLRGNLLLVLAAMVLMWPTAARLNPADLPRIFRLVDALVEDFAAMCHMRGWRIVVLGCSERRLGLWSNPALAGRKLTAIPIGRDVVIDVAEFAMVGRQYRNLRQAVQRTWNFGVTTVIVTSPKGSRTSVGSRCHSTARWRAAIRG